MCFRVRLFSRMLSSEMEEVELVRIQTVVSRHLKVVEGVEVVWQ